MTETPGESWWGRQCSNVTPRDRANLRRVNLILLGWMVCLLGGTYLIRSELVPAGALGWTVATLPSLIAVFAVIAFARFLHEADELQRAIHLQALAMGMGAAFVAWPAYSLFENLGAPVGDWPDIGALIAGFYMIGILLARRRYR